MFLHVVNRLLVSLSIREAIFSELILERVNMPHYRTWHLKALLNAIDLMLR